MPKSEVTKDWYDGLTWATLQSAVNAAAEDELKKMLEWERRGQRRVQFVVRIFGRFNRLRTQRERVELLGGAR